MNCAVATFWFASQHVPLEGDNQKAILNSSENSSRFSNAPGSPPFTAQAFRVGFRRDIFPQFRSRRAACEQGFHGCDSSARPHGHGGDGAGFPFAGDESADGMDASAGCHRSGSEGRARGDPRGGREEAEAKREASARGEGADIGDEKAAFGGEEAEGEDGGSWIVDRRADAN